LPFETTAALDPFAIDYIDLGLSGPVVIAFAGDATAALIVRRRPRDTFWFAPPDSSSRAQLTAAVVCRG
jgi:hypothetical protein